MTRALGLSLLVPLLSLLAACQSAPAARSPETPAPSPVASPKAPDLTLEPGSSYVKNPALTLPREYWVVVREVSGSHFLFPRPDGAEALQKECTTGSPLAARLAAHALCQPASSSEEVAQVNHLSAELALEVSSFLHHDLSFRRSGESITPAPFTNDLLALCGQFPELRAGVMKARCDDEERYAAGGPRPALFMPFSEAELEALPAALNALYGVGPSALSVPSSQSVQATSLRSR